MKAKGKAKTNIRRRRDRGCQEVGGEKLEECGKERDSWKKLLKKALA